MPKGNIRDISPLLQKWRNFLSGRQHTLALRFQDDIATRSPPLPNLPDGVSHKLHNNYYYARDGRREVKPPLVVSQTQLLPASSEVKSAPLVAKNRAPGKVYQWDSGRNYF